MYPQLPLARWLCLTTISIELVVRDVMTKKPYLDFSPRCHFALSKGDILGRLSLNEDERGSIPLLMEHEVPQGMGDVCQSRLHGA